MTKEDKRIIRALLLATAYVLLVVCVTKNPITVKADLKQEQNMIEQDAKQEEERKTIDVSEWAWDSECYECIQYTVKPGDTIWTIAERLYPDRDPRQMEWAIRRANGLEGPKGPIIHPGQELWIPDPKLYGIEENN